MEYPIAETVLIESDWNLKLKGTERPFQVGTSINRIRLEFKVKTIDDGTLDEIVLIESDWNLKLRFRHMRHSRRLVLIESDWNLK